MRIFGCFYSFQPDPKGTQVATPFMETHKSVVGDGHVANWAGEQFVDGVVVATVVGGKQFATPFTDKHRELGTGQVANWAGEQFVVDGVVDGAVAVAKVVGGKQFAMPFIEMHK